VQAGQGDHLVDVAGMRVHRGEMGERLPHPNVAVKPGALEDDPDSSSERRGTPAWVEAEHADLARAALAVALEDLDCGGLTGAVRPQQAEDLAATDHEVDPPDSFEIAIRLVQSADLDCCFRHATMMPAVESAAGVP